MMIMMRWRGRRKRRKKLNAVFQNRRFKYLSRNRSPLLLLLPQTSLGQGLELPCEALPKRGEETACVILFFLRKEMMSFSTSSSLAASIFPVADVLRLQASSLSERSRDTETFSRAVRHAPEGREARRAQGEGVHTC